MLMFAKFMSIAPKLGGFVLGDSFGILPGKGDLGKTSRTTSAARALGTVTT